MREDIITLLKNKDTMSLDFRSIQKKLEIKEKFYLETLLKEMVNDGTLYYSGRKEKYLLFENSTLIKGEIVITSYGDGYVEYNGEKIKIPKEKLNGAMHKDFVTVNYDRNWLQGEVDKIIKRDNSQFVAEVISKRNKLYAKGLRRPLMKLAEPKAMLVEGHKVLVQVAEGKARVIKIIGHKDDPGVDIKSILYEEGFGRTWSSAALQQLANIPNQLNNEVIAKELEKGRIDLRNKSFITMDCDDTKDIDDGYCIEKLENGNIKLIVVIADVDEYVGENSPIDIEARTDSTSVYPPGSVDPMLDHKLSNGICSLNSNTDRLAMSYTMEIDESAHTVSFQPALAVINSKKKMCYSDVNKILEEETMVAGYEDFYKELLLSQRLYLQIKQRMEKNNCLDFNTKEAKVILDELGKATKIELREQRTAEHIIEYFMLLTNTNITNFLKENNLPCIYRIDGEPNQDKLRKVFEFASLKGIIGYDELKNEYTTNDIQKLVKKAANRKESIIINRMLIRCMDKAKYSTKNIGHYPLGLSTYGQHTSPIRRYPDLQNQRILKYALQYGGKATNKKFNKKCLEEACRHFSERERAAQKCEIAATEMKIIELLEKQIGQRFTATISRIDGDGFYILLDNTLETYIRKSNLPRDNYEYIEYKSCLHGHKFDFSLGDEIEIRLTMANKDTRTTRFSIVKCQERKQEKLNLKPRGKIKTKRKNNNKIG